MKNTSKEKSTKRHFVPKLSIAFISFLLALLLVEFLFRVTSGERVRLHGLWSADEVLGAALTPGFEGSMRTSEYEYQVSINDLQMRDHPIPEKNTRIKRVLVVGDSFVYGIGVNIEDSLPKSLGRHLNSVFGSVTFEAFNAGMPGTSTFHHMHFLERLAPIIQPDVVLHMFFVGDDWFGNAPRRVPGRTRKTSKGWLKTRSTLYRYLDRFFFSRLRGSDQYRIHRLHPETSFLNRMENSLRLLENTRAIAQRHNANYVIGIIPRYVQVYDEAWAKVSLVFRLSSEDYSILEPNRRFKRLLNEKKFWYLDLLPYLRSESKKRVLHFPIDGHWNREGTDFVAEVLADEIFFRTSVLTN